jgi:hypothetical protein
LQASSIKKSVQNFFSVSEEEFVRLKFPCIYRKQDFSLFLLMVGLSPGMLGFSVLDVLPVYTTAHFCLILNVGYPPASEASRGVYQKWA